MTNYTVKLSQADLNMIFRGLTAWCSEQSREGNSEGTNETREFYNWLDSQTIMRAPLSNDVVWMKNDKEDFIQYASGRVIRWQCSRDIKYSTRATPDDGICLYVGSSFKDAVLALPQNAIYR
jgi:hypothetical protein